MHIHAVGVNRSSVVRALNYSMDLAAKPPSCTVLLRHFKHRVEQSVAVLFSFLFSQCASCHFRIGTEIAQIRHEQFLCAWRAPQITPPHPPLSIQILSSTSKLEDQAIYAVLGKAEGNRDNNMFIQYDIFDKCAHNLTLRRSSVTILASPLRQSPVELAGFLRFLMREGTSKI